MITHWLDVRGMRCIETMGWPTWKCDERIPGAVRTLSCRDGHFEARMTPDVKPPRAVDRGEARSILRDHAREWLLERDITIVIWDGDYWACKGGELWLGPNGGEWSTAPDGPGFSIYDLALLAAIEAEGEST